MSKKPIKFQFEIGDEVCSKAALTEFPPVYNFELRTGSYPRATHPPIPQKLVVVSRIAEECCGGVQIHYKVRAYAITEAGFSGDMKMLGFYPTPIDIFEFELVPWATVMATARPIPEKRAQKNWTAVSELVTPEEPK